jgi:glyoxylase-like metal-dependent hydrolase (beta-lactamase superfamily II)
VVTFTDGRSFVCAGDAAYTLQAIIEHTPTGRGTDPEESMASLHTLTSLGAEILTAHDIDQWRAVTDASLIHSA